MVLYKQSNRPGHGCLDFFNLRRPHDAHFRRLNHQHRRDYVVRQNAVRALDNVVTFADAVLVPKGLPSPFCSSRTQLLATELTCAYQANVQNLIH